MSEPVAVPVTAAGPDLDMVRIGERGGAAVVTIRGAIDVASASLLRDALSWAVGCHDRVVGPFPGSAHRQSGTERVHRRAGKLRYRLGLMTVS